MTSPRARRTWIAAGASVVLAGVACLLAPAFVGERVAPPREVWLSFLSAAGAPGSEVRLAPDAEPTDAWTVEWRGAPRLRPALSWGVVLWANLRGTNPAPADGYRALVVSDADDLVRSGVQGTSGQSGPTTRDPAATLQAGLARPRRHLVEQIALPEGLTPGPEFVGRWVCEDLRGILELRADGTATCDETPGATRRWGSEGRVLWLENFRPPGPDEAPVTLARAVTTPGAAKPFVIQFASGAVGRRAE